MSRPLLIVRQVSKVLSPHSYNSAAVPRRVLSQRFASTVSDGSQQPKDSSGQPAKSNEQPSNKKKSQAELDRELQLKMRGLSGDGGEAGIEYEDGQPVAMKRSVRNNMFRYI